MSMWMKVFFLINLLCICSSCSNGSESNSNSELKNWMLSNGKVKTLSTIAMIGDLVNEIGDGYVDNLTLIKGDLDPHSYQLIKGDDEKLAFADLIFYNGLGLEHGPSLQHHLQKSNKSVSIGDTISEDKPALIIKFNGQLDPHIWMDVSLWNRGVDVIVDALALKDPQHAGIYRANGKKLSEKMSRIHEDIKRKLQSLPSNLRYLVTSHDAFNYFARAYLADESEKTMEEWGKRFAAPEGLAPESQLSAVDIKNIIDHVKLYHIKVLFPESNVSKDSIRKIMQASKEKGLVLTMSEVYLYGDAMGAPGSDGDSYLKMMEHNAQTIYQHLKESSP